jgi:hypothetical protein
VSSGRNAAAEAAERGGDLEIIAAGAGFLQLDVDAPSWAASPKVWAVLASNKIVDDAHDILQTRSQGGNCHVYIRLCTNQPRAVRVAIQTALGSDPVHELLSVLSPAAEDVLFETPEEAARVYEWLNAVNVAREETFTFIENTPREFISWGKLPAAYERPIYRSVLGEK